MFNVEFKKSAKKELDELPTNYRAKIIEAANFLSNEPYPFKFYDVRKVKGRENIYGIRIGKYRFLYEILKGEHLILVFKVEQKSDTTYKF